MLTDLPLHIGLMLCLVVTHLLSYFEFFLKYLKVGYVRMFLTTFFIRNSNSGCNRREHLLINKYINSANHKITVAQISKLEGFPSPAPHATPVVKSIPRLKLTKTEVY